MKGIPNVDGGLELVAREHPDLDHGFRQLRDALSHPLLVCSEQGFRFTGVPRS